MTQTMGNACGVRCVSDTMVALGARLAFKTYNVPAQALDPVLRRLCCIAKLGVNKQLYEHIGSIHRCCKSELRQGWQLKATVLLYVISPCDAFAWLCWWSCSNLWQDKRV